MGPGKRKPEAAQQAWQLSDPRSLRSAPRLTYAIKAASSHDLLGAAGVGLALFVVVVALVAGGQYLRPDSGSAQAAAWPTAAGESAAPTLVVAAVDPSHVGYVALEVQATPTPAEVAPVLNELVPVPRVLTNEFGDGMPSDIPYLVAMASQTATDPAEFVSRAALSARSSRPAPATSPTPPAAPPSPTPRPTPSREIRKYTVKPGDTLNSIADAHGITVATIIKANGIEDSEIIREGDVLVILPISGFLYEVQEEDTVLSLAERFGVTPEDIVAANGLTNPDLIPNGLKLIIPEYVHRGQAQSNLPDSKPSEPLKVHTYTVENGDSVQGIAEQFNIRVETLLWANAGLKLTSTIHPGDQLIVPPVDGVLHEVQADETVFAIAARYGASAVDIVEANGLREPYVIVLGQVLIVPGGSPSGAPIQAAAPTATPKPATSGPRPTATRPVPVATQRPQPTATPKPPAPKPATPAPAAPKPAPAPAPAAKPAGPANASAANIALQYRGWNYVWGGTSPSQGGFDCSGLTWFAYRQAGRPIPRDLWGQMNSGARIQRGSLQYGDLVFFQNTYTAGLSHVGIYIGGNSFVHASSERTGVIVSSLGDAYWGARYLGATRP